MPELIKIDHIHIYVPDQLEAESWYQRVLDFQRVEKFAFWFTEGDPLTIENGDVHIALFRNEKFRNEKFRNEKFRNEKLRNEKFRNENLKSTTTAFLVDAKNYKLWKHRLTQEGVSFRESDHTLSWSIYFTDPYDNPFEITSYDYHDISNAQ